MSNDEQSPIHTQRERIAMREAGAVIKGLRELDGCKLERSVCCRLLQNRETRELKGAGMRKKS